MLPTRVTGVATLPAAAMIAARQRVHVQGRADLRQRQDMTEIADQAIGE
jgi:hypothetical protein